ncbi:sugar phosphate isomerase/epimerase [Bacillus sp. FJAT-26390]|uniref:sugar phosphate isomerase/epimerase family protein n=1 Tax=Bacillus sp. FJAT-26390 TaxID=1743142 RepID=UPI000807DB77|nr:TIM barrel protein [Bacillus sp. FJAT-26390]OBZ11004.1 xylose isomerase [Bacillus sp. FJAT-26390]
MNISIGGYSFNNTYLEGKMDVFGYLETVKYRYRMDVVDLWNGFFIDSGSKPIMKLADESYIRKIREALDEKEMRVVNLAIDGAHLWDPDEEMRQHLYDNALLHLRASVLLGAETVRIDTGGSYQDWEKMGEAQFEYTVKRYQQFAAYAADHGFLIGPENHMGASLDPNEMKRLAEAVDHPSFGFLVHLGRWKVDQAEGDRIVAPWAYHTHFDVETANSDHAIETIHMLQESGYKGYWGVEYNALGNQYVETELLISKVKKLLVDADQQSGRGAQHDE